VQFDGHFEILYDYETDTYWNKMDESTPQRGRPRSETSRTAILESAFAMMGDRGYDAMSIEAVAARAGVGKATVYRWWKTKAEMAVDAFLEGTREELELPDTGSAREDFRHQITALAALLRGPRGRALAGMLGGARNDAELAKALRERWLGVRRAWGAKRMGRAIVEGETRDGVTLGPALALLYGPIYTPLLFGDDPPSNDGVAAILDLAFAGIFHTSADAARPNEGVTTERF
jgi:AcrR family transcriptional regulator